MIKQRIMAMLLAVSMITTTLVSPVVEAQAADVPQIEINKEVPAEEKESKKVSDATSGNSIVSENENEEEKIKSVADTDILYSGTVDNLTWSIDENGHFVLNGTGDYGPFCPWEYYTSYIKSAEINVTEITSLNGLFEGCVNLESVDFSNSDTSNVTDMSWMFDDCHSLTVLDLSGLDTSSVTDMGALFLRCCNLKTLDLSGLDTSNVIDMSSMFGDCESLTTLDFSGFDTSNVVNMSCMFDGCKSLTTLDLSGFDTSNVVNMSGMFRYCKGLTTLNLCELDTSNVVDMSSMFAGLELTTLELGELDTSKVTDMSKMFYECEYLTTLELSELDTSNVVDMLGMFEGCKSLTTLELGELDTSKVITMSDMFYNCKALTGLDLSGLDTSNVADMSGMFAGLELTTLNLSNLDTSKVTNMSDMFYNCKALTRLDLSGLDTSKVTNMSNMFYNCKVLTRLDLSGLDTSNVIDMSGMFEGCKNLTTLNLSDFNMENVIRADSMLMDTGITDLHTPYNTTYRIELPKEEESGKYVAWVDENGTMVCTDRIPTNLNKSIHLIKKYYDGLTEKVKYYGVVNDLSWSIDTAGHFELNGTGDYGEERPWLSYIIDNEETGETYNIINSAKINVKNITSLEGLFEGCNRMKSVDLSNLDTSKVTDMSNMFCDCDSLTALDVSGFDTSKVTNMSGMFDGLSVPTLNLSGFDTSNVTDMSWMFYDVNIPTLDLSSFDTSNVTDMSWMFSGCSYIPTSDLSSFDTSNVTDMSYMFYGIDHKTLDLSGLDTSNVTDMSFMFAHCRELQELDLRGFNTSNVTDMSNMFLVCDKLKSLDLSNFDMQNVSSASDMLSNSGILELHTPYNVNIEIELPTAKTDGWYVVWYDDNGKTYSNVPEKLDKSIHLSTAYTVADATSPDATAPDALSSGLKEGKNDISMRSYRTYKFEFVPEKTGCYDIYTTGAKFIGKLFGEEYSQKIHGYATRTGVLKAGETYTFFVFVYDENNGALSNVDVTIDISHNPSVDSADSNLEPEIFEEGDNKTGLWANYDYKFSFTPKESGTYNIVSTNGMFVGEIRGEDYSQQISGCSIRTGLLKAGETYTFNGVCIGVDEYEGSSDKIFINVNISFNENHAHLYLDTDWTTEKAATCTEEGLEVCVCSVEGCNEQTTRVIPVTEHTKAVDKAVAATCEGTGLTEGSHCSVCKKVLVEQKEVPALGHTKVVDKAVAATCEGTGLTEGSHCSVCKKVLVEQKEVPALGHTKVVDKAVAATCEGTGLTEGSHCSVCKKVLVAQKVIPALGHTKVVDKAVVATCEGTGLTEGSHCSVCKKVLVVQKVVPALGHTKVVDKAVAATFEAAGLTEGSHCSVCKKVFAEQKTITQVDKVTLSKTKYTYDGNAKKPTVTVIDKNGNTLVSGKDYTVSYEKGRKVVGVYDVTVTLKGNYSGSKIVRFSIVPKAPTSAKATLTPYYGQTAGYDDVKFSWSKATGASGYTVYYKKSTASSYTYLTRTTKTYVYKKNLDDGVKYTFKVVPYYKEGNTRYTSLNSKIANVYTLKKLATPKVVKSGTKVKVSWKNIGGESGYQISRSTSKTGTNIVLTYSTTSGTSKTVSATKGKTYYYKVRAYKTVDGKKIYAPWSAVKAYKR